jgi:hypothetical protein
MAASPVRVPGRSRDRTSEPGRRAEQLIDCVKDGKKPPADAEQSHRATVWCHLANIFHRTGLKVLWDGVKETIPHDPAASALLKPPRREGYELPNV